MRILASFLLLTLLSGCIGLGGQKGSLFKEFEAPRAGTGQIYIYRPYKLFWLKAYPNVMINEVLVGELRNGTYVVVNIPPGNHEITLPSNSFWAIPDMTAKLKIEAGERIFLRVGARLDHVLPMYFGAFGVVSMSASAVMTSVNEDLATEEIVELLKSE